MAPVADVVAAADLPSAAAEAVLARVEISSALGADRLSAEVLEHVAAFEPLPSHRVAGGNQRLAEAMAAELGDRVRLGTPVRALDELDADHVVLAVSLPALSAFALPDWKRAALDRVAMGHAAKLHVPLARPAPPSAVMSVPDRYWCWTTAGDEPVLNCFAGSPAALERLGRRHRARTRGSSASAPSAPSSSSAPMPSSPRGRTAPTARPAATRTSSPRPPVASTSRASTPPARGRG